MLPNDSTYAELAERFQWHVPEFYNIGADVCDKWAERDPARVALLHKTRAGEILPITFDALRALSNQTANLLRAYGVQRGDRVGILLPQAPETGYAHIAVYKLGALAVPLFTLFGVDALRYRLADSDAKIVITDSIGAQKVEMLRDQLPALEYVFNIDGVTHNAPDFHALRNLQAPDFEPEPTRADDPALIIYTSGTTGQPKGALHAHRVLLGHLPGVEMSHNVFPQDGDRIWTPADWAWIGGLYDVLMPAWHHGVTVVSHRFEKFDAAAAFQLIQDFEIRNAFLPPTALKMMRTIPHPETRWNFKVRTLASGGETLGAELLEWGRKTFGITINEFYGQTECNMIVSNCSAIMQAQPGVMGRAVPGHALEILDADGIPVSRGQVGEIGVKRPDPVMFLEYWNNPDATRAKFKNDFLLTGDMGVMDEEGYIRFVGRSDDVINSAGYRIGPGEIEDCLLKHPAVKMAAVIGVPDELRGEVVKAFIVLDEKFPAQDSLAREIQNFVREHLSAHEYPRHISFVRELPLTTTGKIMRRTLREWHAQNG